MRSPAGPLTAFDQLRSAFTSCELHDDDDKVL